MRSRIQQLIDAAMTRITDLLAIVAVEPAKQRQKGKNAAGYSSSKKTQKAPERRSKSSEVIKKGKDADKEEDNDDKPQKYLNQLKQDRLRTNRIQKQIYKKLVIHLSQNDRVVDAKAE